MRAKKGERRDGGDSNIEVDRKKEERGMEKTAKVR